MKRITVFLFLVFFALWTGQSQTVSKTAISNQKVNSTKSVAVLDSQMENKVGNSQSNQSNAAIDELLARVESLGTQVENVTEFFTTSEIQQLRAHFQQARGFNVHPVYEVRSDNNAYGINNAIPSFGSFNHLAPAGTFTPLSGGSGTAGFEGAGAIDPANPSVGYAMDIDGFLYQVNVDTGVYTNLGNTGILEVNGMAFNPVDGTLYAITGTSVYTVDPSVSSLTLVGDHGIPGTFAIALGISDDGVGYTYDIGLDQLFSINLSTGVATLIGNIGFDANFGQGMDWDAATGTMYMAAFNLTSFNTEIRSVNLTTGATTLIGYIDTVNLVQMGWVSFVGSSGGGGGDCSSPTVDINQDQENTCMATISQQGIAQSFTAESPMSAGAGLKFNGPVSGGQVLEIYLYDELPTNGGVVLASGSTTTAGGETWVDVFWTTATSTAVGDMYYLVFEGTVTTCISGTTFDSYAGGHLYANAGYTPFSDWDYTFRHYGCEGGGGGGDCSSPTVDIDQDESNTCMATISQQGIAQSFTAESDTSAGAGFMFTTTVAAGQTLEVGLWDNLPNAGGVLLTSGSVTTPGGDAWVDVFWDTPASTTIGDMYYLVVEGTVLECMAGTTYDSYPGGHLYANAGYGPFPDWDYTFRHYGCEGGGGGGDCEPGNITTIFTGGNQFAGNMFDITASGGEDIQIESFDINMDPGSGLISVYYKSGSYIGFESDASAWTLLGAETVTSMGTNNPTPLNVGGLTIPAGETYGIYISSTDYTTNNFTMNYTNGDFNYTDAYMTIETGVGKGNPDFTGSTFDSRSWNGTVYYCAGEGGGGGGDCSSPVVDINQDESNTCMAFIDQAGIAQSFTAESDTSAGAGFMFTTDVAAGQALQIGLWDNLPNSGGVLMASGSVTTAGGDAWVDVFWTDPVSITIGDMYYLVVEGTVGECIAGTTYDSYPGGHLYANAGYGPFPDWDYTFRHYGCEGGGGGGDECTYETLSNGVEDGTPNSLYGTANDFIVPADETFTMEQVVVPILTSPGTTILYADLTYFDNSASNLPGATLGSENGITPTSQDIIGSAFGFDVREVVLDITPFTFEAGATDTNFWVQIHTPNSSGSATYWESNNSGPILGYPTAGFDGATWSYAWGANYDGVFQYNGDCSGSGGGGGPVGDCDEENARIGAVLDGLNCSIGGGFKVANDITVPADFDFHLEQIRANILSVGDITEVNVVYYDNSTSSLPGTQIASEMGVVPTSQTVVGSAFGYDVIEITLDVPTYIFAGQMGSTTTYWIGLEVSNVSSSTSIFWEVTNENSVGYATAFNNGGWSIWDPSADGVYLWGGNCEPVIVNSEEAPLIGFSYYPNPASDVIYLQADQIIDSVDLYNVLGQQVLSQSVKAQSSQLDVSGLAAGTYLMSVESEGTLHTYQVIKM